MIVNSHNEWDTLEEVIIGNGFPSFLPALELTFKLFFYDNIKGRRFNELLQSVEVKKKYIEEMEQDVDKFVQLVKDFGVKVKRPIRPKKVLSISTPYWKSTTYQPLEIRDQTLIIGSEIIETPPTMRIRYFENDYLKHLFKEYFDNGAKWTVVPKPLMLDSSYDFSYIDDDEWKEKIHLEENKMDYGYEIMFDAAQCMRFGRDIIFNCSTENHRLGLTWLQRHLGSEYKVWEVNICDSHIDSTIVPLKPGVLLVAYKSTFKSIKQLPKWLQKWDIIEAPLFESHNYDEDDLLLASKAIDINILSLDQNTIICHKEYRKSLQPLLKPYNIECVPCELRHRRIFAGAFHCMTLDIRRKSKLEWMSH
jgi:glycine amidinotransferase